MADKTETTVSLDFGRISLNEQLVLYLFGTPGQERFWFLWNGLFKGALGAVVLVDTRRLASSFRAIEEMERLDVPFVIALNVFPDSQDHPVEEIRDALDISPHTPIVACDARDRASSRDVLIALIRHLKERSAAASGAPMNAQSSQRPLTPPRGLPRRARRRRRLHPAVRGGGGDRPARHLRAAAQRARGRWRPYCWRATCPPGWSSATARTGGCWTTPASSAGIRASGGTGRRGGSRRPRR